jgi:nucleoside-diphosphate-sugar epimerase
MAPPETLAVETGVSAMSDRDCGLIVTGASGWIGRAVVSRARQLGHPVVAAGRRSYNGGSSIQATFDLQQDETAIVAAIGPCLRAASRWALIHCAGLAHVKSETRNARQLLQRINVEGTATLARSCISLGVSRFLYVSSISVYAWDSSPFTHPRTEMDSTGPQTEYGKTKLEGERIVMGSDLDWRVARLATVFGPGDTANFYRLARAIKRRRFYIPGHGEQRKSCIDVETAAGFLVTMATLPAPAHRLVNVAAPKTPTLAEISSCLAEAVGVPAPPRIPASVLRLAGYCGDLAGSLRLPTPVSSGDLERLCAWTWVDASRAIKVLPELESLTFAGGMDKARAYYNQV